MNNQFNIFDDEVLNYTRKFQYLINGFSEKPSEEFDPNEAWIQTFSGKRFTPMKPNIDAITIEDIARALSMQCRFTGHVNFHHSVAYHSVLVSYLCDYKDRLWGLVHDASEAYICDLSSPLKKSGKFDFYKEVEKNIMNAICQKFGLDLKEPESVKRADLMILATEARDLLPCVREDWKLPYEPIPMKIQPITPEEAEKLFLNRFSELINEKT